MAVMLTPYSELRVNGCRALRETGNQDTKSFACPGYIGPARVSSYEPFILGASDVGTSGKYYHGQIAKIWNRILIPMAVEIESWVVSSSNITIQTSSS